MFIQTLTDPGQFHQEQKQPNLGVRAFKPKLISTLNYQQQYLMRRKKKRNKKRESQKNKTINHANYNKFNKQNEFEFTQQIQGQFKQNKFYKQVYDGNDKIIGNWLNGLLQGQAQVYYHNGDYFTGIFEKGYKISGKMIFNDQAQYQGSFYNELFHGNGTLKLKDKSITAIWVNGIAQNNCIVEYKKGNLYYGPLKQFKKHGYGYLYFNNDTKFFGQFIQGQIKGYGEFYQKGKIKCKGIWLNGKLIKQNKLQEQCNNYDDQKYNWEALQELFAIHDKKDLACCLYSLGVSNKSIRQMKSSGQQEQTPLFKNFQSTLKKKKSNRDYSSKTIQNSL